MTQNNSTAKTRTSPIETTPLNPSERHRDRKKRPSDRRLLNTALLFGDQDLTVLDSKVVSSKIEDKDLTPTLTQIYRDCKTVEEIIEPLKATLVEARTGLTATEIASKFVSHVQAHLSSNRIATVIAPPLVKTVASAQAEKVSTEVREVYKKPPLSENVAPTLQEVIDCIDFLNIPGPIWKLALLKFPTPKYRKIGSRKAQERGETDGPPDEFFQKWYLGAEGDRPNVIAMGMGLSDLKKRDPKLTTNLKTYLYDKELGFTLGEWVDREQEKYLLYHRLAITTPD